MSTPPDSRKQAFLDLIKLGYSPVACRHGGKKRRHPWFPYEGLYVNRQATEAEIDGWLSHPKWGPTCDIAVVCGFNDLAVSDIDNPTNAGSVWEHLGRPVMVRHRGLGEPLAAFYRAPGLTSGLTIESARIEIKGPGSLVHVPPSIHWSGARYEWWDYAPLQHVANLSTFGPEQLTGLQLACGIAPRPAPIARDPEAGGPIDARDVAYARAALKGEAETLAATVEGGRNTQLLKAVCAVGYAVHHGVLTETELRQALMWACSQNGLLADEPGPTEMTIKSGLAKSAGDPLRRPDAPTGGQLFGAPLAAGEGVPPGGSPTPVTPMLAAPSIRLEPSGLATAAEQTQEGLSGFDIYQRSGGLVKPSVDCVMFKFRPTLREVTADYLRYMASKFLRFSKFDGRTNKYKPADPTEELTRIIISMGAPHWSFRPITGLCMCQTLRPDGSLLTEPGYDAQTGMLLVGQPDMAPVPDAPSEAETEEALGLLYSLIREFPFKENVDRAVALSLLMTCVLRPAMNVAPAHAVNATAAGSGKSFLCDLASTLAWGSPAPSERLGRAAEETEKRIAASIIAAHPIICLDNVSGREVEGEILCQLVTAEVIQVRVLGASVNLQCPNVQVLMVNGNGLTISGDLCRRTLMCQLAAKEEDPHKRKFTSNPLKRLTDERGRYVRAVLTIARAYAKAGCPLEKSLPPVANFSGWSRFVREPLVWLGTPDPAATIDALVAADPERGRLSQFVEALAAFGRPMTAQEILDEAENKAPALLMMGGPSLLKLRADMREALQGLLPFANARSLGRWLTNNAERLIEGRRIVVYPTKGHDKKTRYYVTNQ